MYWDQIKKPIPFDASVLIFSEKIAEITNSIGDTPVFFIPARDMVLIAGKQDSAALEMAAHLAQSGYNELAYSISPHGYVIEDGVCKRYC